MTMRAKRIAGITMVTKGIKKGKLPPIKTPKQLDVFVFGEKSSSVMMRQHLDQSHGIIGPVAKSSLSRHHVPNRTENMINIADCDNDNLMSTIQANEKKYVSIKAKRGTQIEI